MTIVHKANIMKISDGLALECARRVAKKHPDHRGRGDDRRRRGDDDGARSRTASACSSPRTSTATSSRDLGAGLVGGLGIVPGANIGDEAAVFEAVHGSAPDIAGKGIANPTAVIQSAVMMLRHIGEARRATLIESALTEVYRRGEVRTGDLGGKATTADVRRPRSAPRCVSFARAPRRRRERRAQRAHRGV